MLNRFACVTLAIAAVTAGAGAADTAKIYTDATSSIVLAVPADQKVSVMQGDKVTIEDIPAEFERVRKDTQAVDTCQDAIVAGQIERLTKIVEGGSSWVFVDSGAKAKTGETYTIYGRGFIAGALKVYKVHLREIDAATSEPKGAPIAQVVTAVTENTIVFKAAFPATGKVVYKTTFVVYEGATAVPGPDSDHTWVPHKPTVEVVEGQSDVTLSDGITEGFAVWNETGLSWELPTVAQKRNEVRLIVSDNDHGLGEIVNLISAVSSDQEQLPNNAVSFELAPEGGGDGATVIMKVDPAKLNETAMVDNREYNLTVTVKDPGGLESVIQLGMVSQTVFRVTNTDGYTLVMKIRGSDGSTDRNMNGCETFNYASAYWENNETYGNHEALSRTPANVKYETFMIQRFKTIRVCATADNTRCHEHTFANEWDSARAMFTECDTAGQNHVADNGNKCRTSEATKEIYTNVFEFSGARDCPVQLPGFSQRHQKTEDTNYVRWGYVNNIPSQACSPAGNAGDDKDADGAIGLGLQAQGSQCKCGAGATPIALYNSWTVRDCRYCRNAFLWVK